MAVVHRWWLLPFADAQAALSGLATLEDVLSPGVTSRLRAIRHDARLARLLITARLDPRDSESWQAIFNQSSNDYGLEQSAAARLVGLLAAVTGQVGELRSPPAVIEAHLAAAGWTRSSIELALRGRRTAELFERLAPRLVEVVTMCQPWLVGGWLDQETGSVLTAELNRATVELRRVRGRVVRELAVDTAFSERELDESLRTADADLRTMLKQADSDHALWIIQD